MTALGLGQVVAGVVRGVRLPRPFHGGRDRQRNRAQPAAGPVLLDHVQRLHLAYWGALLKVRAIGRHDKPVSLDETLWRAQTKHRAPDNGNEPPQWLRQA